MSLRQLRFLVFSGFKNKLVFADDESILSAKKNKKSSSEAYDLKSAENSDESSINNKVCVKEIDWKKVKIPKECQDFYKSQAVFVEPKKDFKFEMFSTAIQKISLLVEWNYSFEETCIILNSLEEKYCGQNKFVAENVEDIWTQLSEGKTIKSILQNSNFHIHKLESLTKEEIEELEFIHEKNKISNDADSKQLKKLSRLYLTAEKIIENYMKNKKISGMECVIHSKRQTIYQKAFGTKDLENYLNYELDTQVNVGEIGAVFTAFLYLAIYRVKCNMNMKDPTLLQKFTQYTPNDLYQTDLTAQQILLGRSGFFPCQKPNYASCKNPQINTRDATNKMFHKIVTNPYRSKNDIKNSTSLKSFPGVSTKSLIAYQLLACEIEKAFNSSDEVDYKEVNFTEILLKFIAWLGLNDHIQVDDSTKLDNRLSNTYDTSYHKDRSKTTNKAYWDYSNLMGVSGIKTSAQGLAKFADIVLHELYEENFSKSHFVGSALLNRILMYYPGAHHVVEKNALNGVESAKFFQDRYYRSLGWETRVWKDINDSETTKVTHHVNGGTGIVYISRTVLGTVETIKLDDNGGLDSIIRGMDKIETSKKQNNVKCNQSLVNSIRTDASIEPIKCPQNKVPDGFVVAMTCNSLFTEDVLELCEQLENLFKSGLSKEEYKYISTKKSEGKDEKKEKEEESEDCPHEDKYPHKNFLSKLFAWLSKKK